MTVAAAPSPGPSSTISRTGWAIGAGGAYLATLPLVIWFTSTAGLVQWPYIVIWCLTIGISGAHYGATYLRVYGNPAERRKYGFFAIWVTAVLVVLLAVGAISPLVGSAIVTLYVSWSPWHFAGQNYGIALLFLRRANVTIPNEAKRFLHASFVLSFVLAFVALHRAGSNAIYAPTGTASIDSVRLLSLSIPSTIVGDSLYIVGSAYAICTAMALWLLKKHATSAQLLPVVMLALCQALWFALPAIDSIAGGGGLGLVFGAVWISAAHSLQYLWVTRQYDVQQDGEKSTQTYLLKTTLLGNLAFAIPVALLASTALGGTERAASVPLVAFAAVNVHHFILDGAVWKLRDGRVARLLIRRDTAGETATNTASTGWRLVWVAAAFFLLVEASSLVAVQAEKMGAYRVASKMIDTLGLLGKDDGITRLSIGRRYLDAGDFAEANRQFQESLRRMPSVMAYLGSGFSYESSGQLAEAEAMYDEALALSPSDPTALLRAGLLQLKMEHPKRAAALLSRSLEFDADNAQAQRGLERAQRALEGAPLT